MNYNLFKKYLNSFLSIFKSTEKFKYIGKNVIIKQPSIIEGRKNVSIGNNTVIGNFVHIWGNGGVEIGNNVLIASHCCITSLGHDFEKSNMNQTIKQDYVKIEDDVWLGYNCTILPGTNIGKGSVIGAGSVVTKNIPPFSIAFGNPAKIIKKRIIKD